MSINAILTSDKANFSNYFSDPIVMPSNSQVALTAACITLPYFVQNILIPPILETADERTSLAVRVNIDGIAQDVTWREIFNAYISYGGIVSLEPNLTEDLFFGGSYEIFTNNKITCTSEPPNAARDGEKPTINWALAAAIDAKYEFYAISDASTWTEPKVSWISNNRDGTVQRRTLVGPAATYNDCEFSLSNCTEIAFNVSYMPGKITAEATTDGALAVADLVNMTYTAANSFLTTTATGAQAECMGAGNDIDIDLNGGYIRCSPNIVSNAGKLWFGLSLEGRGDSDNNRYLPINTASPTMIDVGFEFSVVGGQSVYRMVDGRTVYNAYDGNALVNGYSPTYYPSQSVKTFNNDTDGFALLVRRGNVISGNFQYVVDFFMGPNDEDIDEWSCVYSSKTTLNHSSIQPVPIFLGSANVAGNQLKTIKFIAMGSDTTSQGQALLDYGGGFYNTVAIQPYTNGANRQEINFWKSLGLNSMDTDMAAGAGALEDYNDGAIKVSYSGTPLNKTISWKPNFRDGDNDGGNVSYYYIGYKAVNRFYKFSATGLLEVNSDYLLGSLPKYLNVYLLNVPVKNYSGTYPAGFSGGAGAETETGENRIIGTIPFTYPKDTEVSNELEIFYETFNPYYRPVNNSNTYTLNDMLIEVSFKDFTNDRRITIEEVIGTIKLELNIKGGTQPNLGKATRHNDLVPII